MNIENFEKARSLKARIEQLKYLKEYLKCHFEKDSVFSVTTKTQIARKTIADTIIAENSEWYGFPHIDNIQEELDVVFGSIDDRIIILEKQFAEL